jgi:hypothetical protein
VEGAEGVKPVPANRATQRDYKLAREAEHYGAKYATRIILECRAHDVDISDGLALIEQESEFKNIFGGDYGPTHNGKAVPPFYHHSVTKHRVSQLLGGYLMNGVGPAQLTARGFIEEANRDGGAHRPSVNIATGIAILGRLQKKHGRIKGFGAYNGGEGNPNMRYAQEVIARSHRWHRRFHQAGLA